MQANLSRDLEIEEEQILFTCAALDEDVRLTESQIQALEETGAAYFLTERYSSLKRELYRRISAKMDGFADISQLFPGGDDGPIHGGRFESISEPLRSLEV